MLTMLVLQMNTLCMGSAMIVHYLLYLVAMVLFLLEGLGVPEHPRGRYLGWGLFLFLLSMLLTA